MTILIAENIPTNKAVNMACIINDKVFMSGGFRSSPTLQLNEPNNTFFEPKYEDDVHVLDLSTLF